MNTHLLARTFTTVVCLAVLFWSGCANFIVPETGAIAREDSRLVLTEEGVQDAVWEAKDLLLTYSITRTGDEMQFSGQLIFDRSLTDSFGVMNSFFLKMSFLNGDGQVLETVDITPVYSALGTAPEKMNIMVPLSIPSGSNAIVFNYYGVFRANYEDTGGDEWTIFYFPFD